MCRWIGAKRQVILFGCITEMIQNNTRLDACASCLRINFENSRQVLRGVQYDRYVAALSGQGRTSATAQQGSIKFTAERNRSDYVVGITRNDNTDRNLAIIGPIGRVESPAPFVEPHFTAKVAPKLSSTTTRFDSMP